MKHILKPFYLILCLFIISGCSSNQNNVAYLSGNIAKSEGITNRPEDITNFDPIHINVYYPNENGSGLDYTQDTIYTLDPQQMMDLLIHYQALSNDVYFIKLETITDNNDLTLLLDLSPSFLNYLNSLSVNEEALVMSSITNTFLEAFDAKKILITVNDENIETLNQTYSDYQYFYSYED